MMGRRCDRATHIKVARKQRKRERERTPALGGLSPFSPFTTSRPPVYGMVLSTYHIHKRTGFLASRCRTFFVFVYSNFVGF
jgi:hypothetical protein